MTKGHFPLSGIFRAERHFLLCKGQLAESGRQKTKENIIPRGKFRPVENGTNAACFHGQHFSCLEGIKNTIRFACLCNYFGRNVYLKKAIKRQKKIKIRSNKSRGKSYPDIKLIHIILIDSLWYIIGVINHWKDVILFSKTFLDGWQKRAKKSPQRRTLMNNDSRITETVVYLYTNSSDNYLIRVGW